MTKDRYRYFRVEAGELLDQLSKGMLDLEKGAADPNLMSRLLRLAHTLKGAARVVKLRRISDLAHTVEDALAPHRDRGQTVTREHINAILTTLDAIGAEIGRIPAPEPAHDGPGAQPIDSSRAVRIEVADVDALLEGLGEMHGHLTSMRGALSSSQRARHLARAFIGQVTSQRHAEQERTARQAVSLLKAQSVAEELDAALAGFERGAGGSIERMDRELRDARDLAERLRLIPTLGVFNALERVVRDAAQEAGKQVTFEARGGDVRLDGHVLDSVQSALAQIVRNAVVHGIETEAERTRAGKAASGRVVLEVSRRRHRVSFRCRDDGRGVDLEAVRRAMQRTGRLPQTAERLGPAELLQLLLQGGITTASSITELSGRGIGLDVVREVAGRLGGNVTVQTDPSTGTTVELIVPVSVASVEVLTVEAAGEIAAIPLDAVRGALRARPTDVGHGPEGASIVHDGELLPLVSAASWLSPGNGRTTKGADQSPLSAVLVAAGGAVVALAVDRLRTLETIVVRPLPALAPAAAIIAGARIDAEGNPCLVLDPEALVDPANRPAAHAARGVTATPTILVIDDSLTTRMLEQSILESAGYRVDLAVSAEQALEKARRHDYGLFLVDVEMPGMDGFEFIERTRADPLLGQVPCILVTSRESSDDRRRGETAGASAYIVKSEFDQIGFLDRVASLVRR